MGENKTTEAGNSRDYGQIAEENFLKGYNCTQAVVLAFSDLHGMEEKTAAKLSSSFGGGMGRLREVCGAVSGMFLVAGMLYGYDDPKDYQGKKEHYKRIQQLAQEQKKDAPAPKLRTDDYYKKRPCPKLVRMAAEFMAQYIKDHPLE